MKKTTSSSCQTYDSPEVTVLDMEPEVCLATSAGLEDMDNNPLYQEQL